MPRLLSPLPSVHLLSQALPGTPCCLEPRSLLAGEPRFPQTPRGPWSPCSLGGGAVTPFWAEMALTERASFQRVGQEMEAMSLSPDRVTGAALAAVSKVVIKTVCLQATETNLVGLNEAQELVMGTRERPARASEPGG